MIQGMAMCTGSSLPVQEGMEKHDKEDGGDQEWRNKSRDKLILDLKRLSFFLPSKKKPAMSDNSVVQSARWKTAS